MKYTYQIKFGSSDYVDFYPNEDMTLEGAWLNNTMIWREEISELKITAAKNATVYALLESWFEDATKFQTRIMIKVLKNNVQDSLHWIGVKWGELDKHTMTYIVQPESYDLWGQYFAAGKDIEKNASITGLNVWDRFATTGTYAYVDQTSQGPEMEEIIKEMAEVASVDTWPGSDVVSSFLFQDAYENASAVGTYRGVPLDYVTEVGSYLTHCGMKTPYAISFSDVIEWLLLFRTFCFFDSNDKLRFEHIKFFKDKLADNAVDFSAYIDDTDEQWSYENVNIPIQETVKMNTKSDTNDVDFNSIDVTYSDIRNRPDVDAVEYSFPLFSNLNYFGSDEPTEYSIWSGIANHTYEFFQIDLSGYSFSGNRINIAWNDGEEKTKCGSNDFRARNGAEFTLTVNLESLTGEFEVSVVDRSSSNVVSNVKTVDSSGVTSDTLTITAETYDAYLQIEGTVGSPGGAIGWITLTNDSGQNYITPTIEGVISESAKTNGALSVANIFNDYWLYDRPVASGTFNSTVTSFETDYNLKRKTIKFHYSGVINPLYGFNDGTRVGKIEKWKRSLVTDFYEIDVIYQEDE